LSSVYHNACPAHGPFVADADKWLIGKDSRSKSGVRSRPGTGATIVVEAGAASRGAAAQVRKPLLRGAPSPARRAPESR